MIVDEEPEINPDLYQETPRRKRRSSRTLQIGGKTSKIPVQEMPERTRRSKVLLTPVDVRTSKNAQVNPGSSTFDASTDTLRRTRRRHHATEGHCKYSGSSRK